MTTPYTGYRVFFYAAGTTTKQATFTSVTGAVANQNPIILNARGEPDTEIWLTTGIEYKMALAVPGDDDPPQAFVWQEDNISAINDSSVSISEWIAGTTPTYVSSTSFTLVGDQTADYEFGRRLKLENTGGTKYGTVATSVYTTLTTITINAGEGPLDSGLSSVSYGIQSVGNWSLPLIAPWYLTGVSGTNTITATSALNLIAYVPGQEFRFIAAGTNTGATTISIDGVATVAVTKKGSTALSAGDIPSGALITIAYDGTRYQLIGGGSVSEFATGTRMSFQQTSAPTGWTKETNATYNDAAFRTVTGTASTGGADVFSNLFGTSKSTASYTLLTADIPSHTHTGSTSVETSDHTHSGTTNTDGSHRHSDVAAGTHKYASFSGSSESFAGGGTGADQGDMANNSTHAHNFLSGGANSQHTHTFTSASTGGGGGHTHTLNNMNLKYVDVIIAVKD